MFVGCFPSSMPTMSLLWATSSGMLNALNVSHAHIETCNEWGQCLQPINEIITEKIFS